MVSRTPNYFDQSLGINRRFSASAGDTIDPSFLNLGSTRILSATGDGSTTVFNLSQSVPAGQELSAIVFIGGVFQDYTADFSISGSTITFTTAPISGAKVRAFYFNTAAAQTSALGQVTETTVNLGTLTANATFDFSKGSVFTATIGAAIQLSWAGLTAGRSNTATLHLRNPGAYAFTWATAPKYPGGTAFSYTASGLDIVTLTTPDGTDANMRAAIIKGYP